MYHSLFGLFWSSFPKLTECPKYHKASITQSSCGFYANNKALFLFKYFGQSILLLWLIFSDFSTDVESHVTDWSRKFWLIFKLRKLIGRKNRSLMEKLKVFSTFCDQLMNKFWLINRYFYFFINAHGQIEKLTAKIRSITPNAWMEIHLKTSFGAKCGVEDLVLLFVYSSPFRVFGLTSPKLT